MKVTTITDAARRLGVKPTMLSDGFHRGKLDVSKLVPMGNRRLVPTSYLPEIRRILKKRKTSRQLAAA